jgi:mxaJ protein
MPSFRRSGIAVVLLAVALCLPPAARGVTPRPVLRVCADPNNLPFSNERGEGFENKIAERLATALGADLRYTWWPQRRGFIRNTLARGTCDVIIGLPAAADMVAHTRPYYRSTYVFVTPQGRPAVHSFDDPTLRRLRIGIPLVGDDGQNPPPEAALARRGIAGNVVGFAVYGNYAAPDPPLDLLRALARGEIDVAAAWGPQAGYFARVNHLPLTLTPIEPESGLTFTFDIAVGVRRGPRDESLRQRLDRALERERPAIQEILAEYGVPRVIDRRRTSSPR